MWTCPRCSARNWEDAVNCHRCYGQEPYLDAIEPAAPSYVLIFGPGVVRYLDAARFFRTPVDSVIAAISQLGTPELILPIETVDTVPFDDLTPEVLDADWETTLRVHAVFAEVWLRQQLPGDVYIRFHRALKLGDEFAFAKCLEAWEPAAEKGGALRRSYNSSPDHFCVGPSVFKITEFVRDHLPATHSSDDDVQIGVEASTIVFLLHDLENEMFKLGISHLATAIELVRTTRRYPVRFAIPVALSVSELNRSLAIDVWTSFDGADIITIIQQLRQHATREAVVDFEWLGRIAYGL